MCFYMNMKVDKIQHNMMVFKNNVDKSSSKNPELIDKLMSVVRNQDDVNDCVAVPRGIFKAYLWIMGGFGLLGIAGALPAKMVNTKAVLGCLGNICNAISAFFFAKPFAFKNVSPTVKMEDLNTRTTQQTQD